MNVFVLNSGRCGSTTFIRACEHINNYSCAHESRSGALGEERLNYPSGHIEADNRLSWFLGRLNQAYGDDAIYVHLYRSRDDVARSFVRRYSKGIIKAYREGILLNLPEQADPFEVSRDYCDTVQANIELFLENKTKKMNFDLDCAKDSFREFWSLVGAEGDYDLALKEFDVKYNASNAGGGKREGILSSVRRKIGNFMK